MRFYPEKRGISYIFGEDSDDDMVISHLLEHYPSHFKPKYSLIEVSGLTGLELQAIVRDALLQTMGLCHTTTNDLSKSEE